MSSKMFRTISFLAFLLAGIVFTIVFFAGHGQLNSQTRPTPPVAATTPDKTAPAPAKPLPPGTVAYTPKANTTALAIARIYLTESSYMTALELEAAIRKANDGKALFHKGDTVLVPGIEPQPVVEKSRPFPKDGEVRAIYLTGSSAGSPHGIELLRRWHQSGGNAVVFDIKDSDGTVNVPFDHPLARKLKSYPISNLPKYVRYLHILGEIADGITLQLARQGVIERDVDGAVAVLDVEHHGVSAALMPPAHQLNSMGAAGAGAGKVDRAHLAVFRERTALLHNGLRLDSR